MIIECNNCATKFRLDESKITGRGVKVRCTKCQDVFIVHAPEAPPKAAVEVNGTEPVQQPGSAAPEQTPEPPPEQTGTDRPSIESGNSSAADGFGSNAGDDADEKDEEAAEPETAPAENTKDRPNIGGLSFDLYHDESDEEFESDGDGTGDTENNFLLDGFNRAHQGSDDIDLSGPEFNLLDDDETPDTSYGTEPENAPEPNDDEEDDFTFEVNTDGRAGKETGTEAASSRLSGAQAEAENSTGNSSHSGPSSDEELTKEFSAPDIPVRADEERPAAPAAPATEDGDDEIQSAFEAALKKAEEEANAVEPASDSGSEEHLQSGIESENSTLETADPIKTTGGIKTTTGADADMRQLINRALETANETVNEDPAQRPVAETPAETHRTEPAWATPRGNVTQEKEPEAGTETEAGTEEAELSVAPYEIDKRGSKSPLVLAILMIVAIGVLLHFTGIAGKVLKGSGPAGELTVGITKMKSYIALNSEIGAVFVVEAQLQNMTDKPQEIAGIQGTLFNKSGKRLSVRKVSPGRVVSKEQLRGMSRQALLKNFKDASGGTIPPKGTVPVMLLFTNAPEATTEFALDVLR